MSVRKSIVGEARGRLSRGERERNLLEEKWRNLLTMSLPTGDTKGVELKKGFLIILTRKKGRGGGKSLQGEEKSATWLWGKTYRRERGCLPGREEGI